MAKISGLKSQVSARQASFFLVRLEERNLCVQARGTNNGRALRDAPFTIFPRSVASDREDVSLWRADQLAALGQGLPVDEGVRPRGQSAGVGL